MCISYVLMRRKPLQNLGSVMVNFMCQLDWITRCPDVGLNILSGWVCEGVFGYNRSLKSVDWVKQISSPQCGCAPSHPLRTETEQKDGGRENFFFLSLCLTPEQSPEDWALHSGPASSHNTAIRFLGFPASRQQILGFLSLCNNVSQTFIRNLFLIPRVWLPRIIGGPLGDCLPQSASVTWTPGN